MANKHHSSSSLLVWFGSNTIVPLSQKAKTTTAVMTRPATMTTKWQWWRRQLPLRRQRRCFPELLFCSYFGLTLLNFFWRCYNWSGRLVSFGGACLRRRLILGCFRHGADFVLCGVLFWGITIIDRWIIFQLSYVEFVKIFLWHQINSIQLQDVR